MCFHFKQIGVFCEAFDTLKNKAQCLVWGWQLGSTQKRSAQAQLVFYLLSFSSRAENDCLERPTASLVRLGASGRDRVRQSAGVGGRSLPRFRGGETEGSA